MNANVRCFRTGEDLRKILCSYTCGYTPLIARENRNLLQAGVVIALPPIRPALALTSARGMVGPWHGPSVPITSMYSYRICLRTFGIKVADVGIRKSRDYSFYALHIAAGLNVGVIRVAIITG